MVFGKSKRRTDEDHSMDELWQCSGRAIPRVWYIIYYGIVDKLQQLIFFYIFMYIHKIKIAYFLKRQKLYNNND